MDLTERLLVTDPRTGETVIIRVKPEVLAKAQSDADYLSRLTRQVFKDKHSKLSNSEKLMPLTLMDASEEYTLYVSASDYHRAVKDDWYATELLQKHKDSVSKQACNSLATNDGMDENSTPCHTKSMTLLIFYEKTGTPTMLQVSPSEHQKALKDSSFTRYLLAVGQPSTSTTTTQICNQEDGEDSDKAENADCLSQSEKETNKTPCRWTDKQTLLLLFLYKENCSQLENGFLSNRKFWGIIVEGLRAKNYFFTLPQCSSKMDSLKRSYKKVKDHNATSGNARKTCDYYDLLNELFHKKPWIKPLSTSGSNIPMTDIPEHDGKGKNKRKNTSENMDKSQYMQQSLENQRKRSEATESYRNKKLKLLQDITQSFKNNK